MKFSSFVLVVSLLLLSVTLISAWNLDARGGDSHRLKEIVNRIIPGLNGDNGVAANQTCGIGNYSFSSMNQSEWMGFDQNKQFYYVLRMCSRVTHPLCTGNPLTNNSMLCQIQTNDTKMVYNIATNDATAMNWTYINASNPNQGVRLVMNNGDYCGSAPRHTIADFICSGQMGNFTVQTSALEDGDCTYTLTVPTPNACSSEDQINQPPQISPPPFFKKRAPQV